MTDKLVLYRTDEKIGVVTLNRPDKLNAISTELMHQLVETLAVADADAATSVVVLCAEGRSFCVGYDIGSEAQEGAEGRYDALRRQRELDEDLQFEMTPWNMRKPVVASVQGHALGGGCELAMFCDLTIAADDALFGEPEIRFSVSGPAIVMPWLIGYKQARELLYMGDMIDAETALRLGMVNRVVPRAELKERTMTYARRLALVAPEALSATKLAINRGADAAGFRNAMQAGIDVLAPLYAAKTEIGTKFVEITIEKGLAAALKWRNEAFAKLRQ